MEEANEEKKDDIIELKDERKIFRIFGITVWRIFTYFIIYSVIGFGVETMFGLAKYGTLESRQSFLYGPFCAIYVIYWGLHCRINYRIYSKFYWRNDVSYKMVGLFSNAT